MTFLAYLIHDIAYVICDIMWHANAARLYPLFVWLTSLSKSAQRRDQCCRGPWKGLCK